MLNGAQVEKIPKGKILQPSNLFHRIKTLILIVTATGADREENDAEQCQTSQDTADNETDAFHLAIVLWTVGVAVGL
eukprot:m.31380 g.31380  ORF g.31380 m.31380 type:complete len:77 (+) comp10685_c0_seq1:522-752(+)